MRKLTILLGLSLIATGLAVAQVEAATPKAGTTCTKLNQAQVSGGYTYTCIKSGKKLVWSKGVKVAVPTPMASPTPIATPVPTLSPIATASPSPTPISSSSPSPTPTPSVTPTPTSTTSPTPTQSPIPTEPKSLDDLIAHPEGAQYWAWKKSAEQVTSSSEVGPKATMIVGPHTKIPNQNLQTAINLDTKLYPGFAHANTVTAIYYNLTDVAWAQQEWAKIALSPAGNEASRMCATSDTCWGALAEIDLKGNGLLLFAIQDPQPANSSQGSGTREAHEYAHTIQATQFVGTGKEANSYCCIKGYMPWWMVEGNAEFTQAVSTFATSYDNYLMERQTDVGDLLANANKTFTQAWFQNYLDTSRTSEWSKPENSWRMYDVGFMVNEILASLKGPAINMQLFKDIANGKTWEQAFEANLGISWSQALPKISTILAGMAGH